MTYLIPLNKEIPLNGIRANFPGQIFISSDLLNNNRIDAGFADVAPGNFLIHLHPNQDTRFITLTNLGQDNITILSSGGWHIDLSQHNAISFSNTSKIYFQGRLLEEIAPKIFILEINVAKSTLMLTIQD